MNYTVITDNGGGETQIYHDIEGQIYTFPTMYRSKLMPGTQVVLSSQQEDGDKSTYSN